MISLIYIFWMYVILFGIVGAMRGWAKELMVSFSVILSLALNHVLKKYIPVVSELPIESTTLFWIRALITIGLVYFGYQTVASIPHLAARAARERLQDSLFGIFLGALNGYLISGTVWFYLSEAGYPFDKVISAPQAGSALEKAISLMMQWMPPHILGEPGIYFAVILASIFVIVVFI